MNYNKAFEIFKVLAYKQVEVLCEDNDLVKGRFSDLMEAYDNDYDAILLSESRYGLVEIPLDEIVSITATE